MVKYYLNFVSESNFFLVITFQQCPTYTENVDSKQIGSRLQDLRQPAKIFVMQMPFLNSHFIDEESKIFKAKGSNWLKITQHSCGFHPTLSRWEPLYDKFVMESKIIGRTVPKEQAHICI